MSSLVAGARPPLVLLRLDLSSGGIAWLALASALPGYDETDVHWFVGVLKRLMRRSLASRLRWGREGGSDLPNGPDWFLNRGIIDGVRGSPTQPDRFIPRVAQGLAPARDARDGHQVALASKSGVSQSYVGDVPRHGRMPEDGTMRCLDRPLDVGAPEPRGPVYIDRIERLLESPPPRTKNRLPPLLA